MADAISYASNEPADNRPAPALHLLAWLTALAVFPLIWMGGLVTSHGVGMSVPDWPNTFGYNMFAVPWDKWLSDDAGGVFYEHSHRLLGTFAGLATIALAAHAYGFSRRLMVRRAMGWSALVLGVLAIGAYVMQYQTADYATSKSIGHAVSGFGMLAVLTGILWTARFRRDQAPWRRRLTVGLLIAIIVQGLMGGFRVTEVSLTLAFLHGIFGQLVFGYAALMIVVTSRWWTRAGQAVVAGRSYKGVTVTAALVCMLVMTQLVLGATMRHDPRRGYDMGGPGLAIPDWPLHYGRLLPALSAEGVADINAKRAFELNLPPIERSDLWLHFSHRCGAYLTTLAIAGLLTLVWGKHRGSGLFAPALTLTVLVLTQVTLGVLTVLWLKPADVATAHQAGGALLLAMSIVMLCRAARLLATRDPIVVQPSHADRELTAVGAVG